MESHGGAIRQEPDQIFRPAGPSQPANQCLHCPTHLEVYYVDQDEEEEENTDCSQISHEMDIFDRREWMEVDDNRGISQGVRRMLLSESWSRVKQAWSKMLVEKSDEETAIFA